MRSKYAATVAVAAFLLVACGGNGDDDNGDNGDQSDDDAHSTQEEGATDDLSIEADFEPYGENVTAVTYDEELVSTEGEVDLEIIPGDGSTQFHLEVDDLEPERDYGAHIHTDMCGEDPDDAGPHYQDDPDPEQPSTDPTYANSDNEVWLDFTTDDDGEAESATEVDWLVRSGEAGSLVIHAEHTSHEEGSAGEAGDRLACVNVPL